ncbi:MAG: hypothetical protein IPL32_15460 [Chloracidobacterium sp.]|nr:hypothetical protein [Chloracidobacterium sp.]
MKICPKCRKTYEDNNLNFCLDDGSALNVTDQAAPTVVMPSPSETGTQQAAPTQWQTPMQQSQTTRKSSNAWIWVLLILGVSILLCGGGSIAGFLFLRSQQSSVSSEWPSLPTQKPSASPTSSSTPLKTGKSESYLTLENYNRLKMDMDRSEVESILGGKGVEISSSSGGGMRFSVNKWEGDNFKSIILTFKNDKIMSRTQVGLDK